jgi:hypothetical protein
VTEIDIFVTHTSILVVAGVKLRMCAWKSHLPRWYENLESVSGDQTSTFDLASVCKIGTCSKRVTFIRLVLLVLIFYSVF